MIKQERIERYKEALLQPDHLEFLIERFGLDLSRYTFRALEGGEDNLNILISDVEGRGVAVARHYLVTPAENVAAELEFVTFLSSHGFPTPAPYRTVEGHCLLRGGSEPSIALFPFVEGEHLDPWPTSHLLTGGRMLARLHNLCGAHDYRIGRSPERERVLREGMETVAASPLRHKDRFLAEVEAFLRDELAAGVEALLALPYGPVHHDMNSGNVLWRNGEFRALIDFDEAQDAPYITDIVTAFQYLAVDEDNRLIEYACSALVSGYCRERSLEPRELRALQFCWDYSNIVGAMEFITGNIDFLESAMECRSFSELYLRNRGRLALLAAHC